MFLKSKFKLVIITTLTCLLTIFFVAGTLFASQAKPSAEIFLGAHSQEQSVAMFTQQADGFWYPGKTAKGLLRIYNKYPHTVQLEKLSLSMELKKEDNGNYSSVNNFDLLKKYTQNMRLNIKKGVMLIFDKTIYDQTFYEMLEVSGSPELQGFALSKAQRINIGSEESIDLEYTVQMDENADNDLQGLLAVVDFHVRVNGTNSDDGDNKRHHYYKDLGHWAHDCIITLLKHEVITGYPDNTICPNNFITRAEAASLVAKGLKLEGSEVFNNPYSDHLPQWARFAILATSEKGIFVGYPPDLFKPNQFITREEMTCILIKAFAHKLASSGENTEITFVDKKQISPWSEEFVLKAVQNNILSGYPDQTFKPRNNITRAEAFTIICKLLGYHNEHTAKVYQGK